MNNFPSLSQESIQALFAVVRVLEVYEGHQHRAGNVEYSHRVIDGVDVYSVKGTSANSGFLKLTSLLRDVVSDIRFFPRKNYHTDAWSPGGFLDAGESLAEKIAETQAKSAEIVIEGHSLGAAAALICASILKERGFLIKKVFLFGCPKVGAISNLDPAVVKTYRNGNDVVTTLPPFYKFPFEVTVMETSNGFLKAHSLTGYLKSFEREIAR